MSLLRIILTTTLALAVPLVAGLLLRGIDRKLSARLQGRIGPPLAQPVYDIFKLLGKRTAPANRFQPVAVWGYLLFILAAVAIFAFRQDYLYLVLLLGVADLFLIIGAFSVSSPYSHAGANRELLQVLAYEPVLLLSAVAIYSKTSSFLISNINQPLLPSLWPMFIGLIIPLVIIMRKSPFDIAASEHTHQEIVRGVLTEFSGFELALIEIAHTYELVVVLAIMAMFWLTSLWGIVLGVGAWATVIFIDNASARLNWKDMLRLSWITGLSLGAINILVLKAAGG